MRRILPALALAMFSTSSVPARGILIPTEKKLPPLAMVNHLVTITIDDQVATTRVEQTFRNHTPRQLEATYIFPVPKGASVDKFTMWVNGNEVKGELLKADLAAKIYTDYVRRTQDPGLLEYLGTNLFRLRIFPVPPNGDQKLTLSYKSVAPREGNLVEFIYPLKTDGKATSTLEKFSLNVAIKDKNTIANIYSPTHAIGVNRSNDHEARITFDRDQGLLDKDFQLFYTVAEKAGSDVGLTALMHRPVAGANGYFMLLIAPRVEISAEKQVPRDMIFVLDTSGSMRENGKLKQAQKALNFCLNSLSSRDRFGLINFSTSVTKYTSGLLDVNADQVAQAKKWVNDLEATGGTAIDEALKEALDMRSGDDGRVFTIVFFTDGQPTIGETNPEKILKNVAARNTGTTRIFTFGVGDDVNATMLDTLADQSRATSTYVRPSEDIEVKVSGMYAKISNPVLTNLKLAAGNDIRLLEIYPPQLPDLFHKGQLVVFGRFSGKGPAALTLSGMVGKEKKDFVYEVTFPDKTGDDKAFVEVIWARRKVGYLLDQLRANGEKKELVDEVVLLAKHYGIATPYTSYLVVPDGPAPVVSLGGPRGGAGFGGGAGLPAPALAPASAAGTATTVRDFARKQVEGKDKDGSSLQKNRARFEDDRYSRLDAKGEKESASKVQNAAKEQKKAYDEARRALRGKMYRETQGGQLGVVLSIQSNNLRSQERLTKSAQRRVNGRNCLEIGGVWIDEGFNAKMKVVGVKAQSAAYFRILERQPKLKDVLKLGNHLVWVTPNGTALIIDTTDGKDKLSDPEIDAMFVAKK